ncbi:MAG: tetratricopeptide repeat protein [Saprospiraceae bacterium]|nr:tetratricopeptide repeat protein [Saprospiraceae bacterium]
MFSIRPIAYLVILLISVISIGNSQTVSLDTLEARIKKHLGANQDSFSFYINKYTQDSRQSNNPKLYEAKINYFQGQHASKTNNLSEAASYFHHALLLEFHDTCCFKGTVLNQYLSNITKVDTSFNIDAFLNGEFISSKMRLDNNAKANMNMIAANFLRDNPNYRNYDLAKTYYEAAIKDAEKEKLSLQFYEIHLAYYLMLYFQEDYLGAIEIAKKRLEIAHKLDNNYIIAGSLFDIGLGYKSLSMYEESIKYYYQALNIWENMDSDLETAYTYNNIALIESELKNYDNSINLFEHAAALMDNFSGEIHMGNRARPYLNISRQYVLLDDLPNALDNIEKAYKIILEDDNNEGLKYIILANMAELQSRQKRYSEAEKNFKLCFENIDKLDKNSEKRSLYLDYTEHLLRAGNYQEAFKYCQKLQSLYGEDMDLESKKRYFASLKNYYQSKGDFKSAFKYLEMETEVMKESLNFSKIESVKTAGLKYQLQKQKSDSEIEVKNLEREVENNKSSLTQRIYLLLVILLGLSLIGIYFYFKDREKNKINAIILEKNKYLNEVNHQIEASNHKLIKLYEELSDQKLKLESELKSKLLYISNRNKVLEKMESKILSLDLPQIEKRKINNLLKSSENNQLYENVEDEYLIMNKDFVDILLKKYPTLTPNNVKLCILYKLGLSNKEIAQLKFTKTESVKVAASRLRKTLGIENQDITLFAFLNNIG